MDIKSGTGYPASALSNFAPHPFVLDGVACASLEGWLQSLKFKDEPIQRHICTLVGMSAKRRGRNKKWQRDGVWWLGRQLDRHGPEFQLLLDRAYDEVAKNSGFRAALLATHDAVLVHSIGKNKESDTILTQQEFCSRLTRIRKELQDATKVAD